MKFLAGSSNWCFINDFLAFETSPCHQSSSIHSVYLQGECKQSTVSLAAVEIPPFSDSTASLICPGPWNHREMEMEMSGDVGL